MKKAVWGFIAVMLVIGLMGCSHLGIGKGAAKEEMAAAGEPGPTVMAGTPVVKMSKKSKVVIIGSGFKPGQEVRILFTTWDGVRADIGYALKPQPKANKVGAWTTTWSCGRFVRKKLIKEGAYTLTVTDAEYNPIAHAPVSFVAAKKKAKKKKK